MTGVKKYGAFLLSLLIALIVLHFVLKVASKAPIVGGIAEKAQDLASGE